MHPTYRLAPGPVGRCACTDRDQRAAQPPRWLRTELDHDHRRGWQPDGREKERGQRGFEVHRFPAPLEAGYSIELKNQMELKNQPSPSQPRTVSARSSTDIALIDPTAIVATI